MGIKSVEAVGNDKRALKRWWAVVDVEVKVGCVRLLLLRLLA